jgi:hypothetical protein
MNLLGLKFQCFLQLSVILCNLQQRRVKVIKKFFATSIGGGVKQHIRSP